MLATLFKRIDYIGFLVDKTQSNKTESDNVIISRNKGNMSNINISWGYIDSRTILGSFKNILSILRGGLFEFVKGISDLLYQIILEPTTEIVLTGSAFIFKDVIIQKAFELYKSLGTIPDEVYKFIIRVIDYIFTFLKPFFTNITLPTFLTNLPSFLLHLLQGGWDKLLIGVSIISGVVGGNIALFIIASIFFLNLGAYMMSSNINDSTIIDNTIINQIYTMVRDIKVFEVDSLESNPSILFGKILDKSCNMTLNIIPNIIKNFLNSTETSDIIKILYYNDIQSSNSKNSLVLSKEKLINVEIPLSAFYYSLLNTRSTYPKELAQDLKEYNQDKDAFMMKLKKKREKNK